MMNAYSMRSIGLVLILVLGAGIATATAQHSYTEDFSTTTFKDTPNTTAYWDIVSGELKLFPFVPTLTGSYGTLTGAKSVAISGNYAFVADYSSGLRAIDISDPANPTLVDTYNTPGYALGIAVSGDYAYLADNQSGLLVIDITDPAILKYGGQYNTPGFAQDVAVSGNYAFVADYSAGLQVIDISDPTNPTLAGAYDTPGTAYSVAVAGDRAFVADATSGLQVIDISDPTNPTLAGAYDTPGTAYSVAVAGDRAFVADATSGLQVIDISDPTAPTLAGTYNTPGSANGVAVSGNRAFVADHSTGGLQVIDISDPTNPTLAGTYDTPGITFGVAVAGDQAFVADYTSLQVIEISEPARPRHLGNYGTSLWVKRVAVSGNFAFVTERESGATDDYGLLVIDISDPVNPTLAGSYVTPGHAHDVDVSGDHVFVGDNTGGLQVIDISNPTTPVLAGSYVTTNRINGVVVSGDHAFVSEMDYYAPHDCGLLVIDISNPTTPVFAGSYDTPGKTEGVAVSGDLAFITDDVAGFLVIDVSDPTNPMQVGSYVLLDEAFDIAVSGDHAFVAAGNSGLLLIDISDPTNPVLAGSYVTSRSAEGVDVSGDHVFLADSHLLVIDISNPASPTEVADYSVLGPGPKDVVVSGLHAFTATSFVGLDVIQVYQDDFDADNNTGRSQPVDASDETILRVQLVTTQTNTVTWEMSADGGVSWQGFAPTGTWNQMAFPGTDLLWRSTHTWFAPGVNPGVTQIEIDWLVEAASMNSIVDVPNDQGGWVRATFTRSALDFPDEATLPIANYGIWRRVDGAALTAALETPMSSTAENGIDVDRPELGDLQVFTCQGRTYVQSRPDLATSAFPPGTWELVINVPALQEDTYVTAVPTLADSSASGINYTVLLMTAHTTTPSVWYQTMPDSGYSVDNIAPLVPQSFAVAYNSGGGNDLQWDECPDHDFQYFAVYRGKTEDFAPYPGNRVYMTVGTMWHDDVTAGYGYYYKVTAVDYSGNESDPATAGTVTGAGGTGIPTRVMLSQNVPNPFNPTTEITVGLPAVSDVRLSVYDVQGRLVQTLADDTFPAGFRSFTWSGFNDSGNPVGSGVYFYRLEAAGETFTRKMLLLK